MMLHTEQFVLSIQSAFSLRLKMTNVQQCKHLRGATEHCSISQYALLIVITVNSHLRS